MIARFQRIAGIINNISSCCFSTLSHLSNMNPPAATESPSDPLPPNAARHPDGTLVAPEQPSVSINSSSSSSSYLATPAPPSRPSTLLIPNAPMQNPPAKGIPAATPASNATPLVGKGDAETGEGVKGIDLSEFDPYATPGPTTTISARAKKSGGDDGAVNVLKGLQAKQDGDQEKQQKNVRVEEQGVDVAMSPAGPSQTVAARPASKRQVQASNNNRPTTPAPAPGSTSTAKDQEASDKEKEPVFNFQGFLKDLKQKTAEPVARYLKRCVCCHFCVLAGSRNITYVLTGNGRKAFCQTL